MSGMDGMGSMTEMKSMKMPGMLGMVGMGFGGRREAEPYTTPPFHFKCSQN